MVMDVELPTDETVYVPATPSMVIAEPLQPLLNVPPLTQVIVGLPLVTLTVPCVMQVCGANLTQLPPFEIRLLCRIIACGLLALPFVPHAPDIVSACVSNTRQPFERLSTAR